ncbi:nitroreductase family protein [Thermodesulfobacteriota bacterium]
MDIYTAIKERRSCRNYLPDPIDDATIEKILEAATWAPSPANFQGWDFVVITNRDVKEKLVQEADTRRIEVFEKSGWKWLNKYDVSFLRGVPVMICVVGDPKKTGADMFLNHGASAYQHGCAAAIQNLMLAAHAEGLGSLWFTLFDQDAVREILNVAPEKNPLALICLGKPGGEPYGTPRKPVGDKITYIR